MATETIRIDGLKDLEKTLREIGPQIKGNPLRAAVRAMTVPVFDASQRHAKRIDNPETRTNISDAMGVRIVPTKERDKYTARGDSLEMYEIGPRKKGKGLKVGEEGPQVKGGYYSAWYAHFVEFGTEKQAAQPFMRPAFNESKQKAVDEFTESLAKKLKKAAAKLAKHHT
jgi:HK97 gp10 family phage protein